jgi:sugar lactone lactonase YvrE
MKTPLRYPVRQHRRSSLAAALAIAVGSIALESMPAFADTLPVTNCTDADAGSLRAVIANAHEADVIDLSALTCSQITLASEIKINRNALTIQGPPGGTFFTGGIYISGAQNFRVFDHKGVGVLELDNLMLIDGKYAGPVAQGGCVLSSGSVTLNNSSVSGCKVNATAGKGGGAGIYAANTVTLNHSSVSGNVADSNSANGAYGGGIRANTLVANYSTIHDNKAVPGPGATKSSGFHDFGGGVFLYTGASSSITNSTVDGNYAYGSGGGIYAIGGTLTISNSTISRNVADNGTSGICAENNNPTTLNVSNSTVAFNHDFGPVGFGIAVDNGSLNLQSSIVANNTEANYNLDDVECFHCTLSGSDNLVRAFYSATGAVPAAGFIIMTSDPQLVPLGARGGPTRTHALLSGSPAIATGANPKDLTYDQRGVGFDRETGRGTVHTDMGAYQHQPIEDEIFGNGLEGGYALGQTWVNTLLGGLNDPQGVAFDSAGNLFFSDTSNHAVKEAKAAGGYQTVVTLNSTFSAPQGIAMDASGNIFIADEGNNDIEEILAAGGYVTKKTLVSGLNHPWSVAVDTHGNIFVAGFGDGTVKEIVAVNGSIPASPTIRTLGSGWANPTAVAVDSSGDVFVADFGLSAVKEMIAVNGGIPASPTINTLGSGFVSPTGIALDANRNVYVADNTGDTVSEILASGGYVTVNVLADGFNLPNGVIVGANGNVFVADTNNNVLKEIVVH